MRLPGSNIEVTFENECVIVRDGNTSKIVAISGMTFEDILTEVQTFAYIRNVRPPRRLLRFILLRAGLPNQEQFARTDVLNEEDLETLTKALGSVDELADRFFSPHYDDKEEAEKTEPDEVLGPEETIEPSLPEEPIDQTIPQSVRKSIWTSDEKIEIVFRFTPENIPQENPEFPIDEVTIDDTIPATD